MSKNKKVIINDWDCREDESSLQYSYFVKYLELGPKRTINKTAHATGVSYHTLDIYSRKHEWSKRAKAYDNSIAESIVEEMRKRHISLAKKLQRRAEEALDKMDDENIKPSDVVKMIELGLKTESTNRGIEDTTKIKIESDADTATSQLLRALMDDNSEKE